MIHKRKRSYGQERVDTIISMSDKEIKVLVYWHLSRPMPDYVVWSLLDGMAKLAHLAPSHTRICVICYEQFIVMLPSDKTECCSRECGLKLRRRRFEAKKALAA